jgi:hypothetical protein
MSVFFSTSELSANELRDAERTNVTDLDLAAASHTSSPLRLPTVIFGGFAICIGLFAVEFVTTATAQSTDKSLPWSTNSKPAVVAQKPAPASPKETDKPTKVAATTPAADFQTMEQLQKAGVKRCLQLAQAVGQATMIGTSEYAAASTWHSKQPDNRFSVSMIGQKFGPGNSGMSNGISGIFSTPTSDGKCDAAALQIIPTAEPCSKTQAQILEKGKSLGTLAGVPILQNAANAQVMLIPGANNSCILVALSTVYTE